MDASSYPSHALIRRSRRLVRTPHNDSFFLAPVSHRRIPCFPLLATIGNKLLRSLIFLLSMSRSTQAPREAHRTSQSSPRPPATALNVIAPPRPLHHGEWCRGPVSFLVMTSMPYLTPSHAYALNGSRRQPPPSIGVNLRLIHCPPTPTRSGENSSSNPCPAGAWGLMDACREVMLAFLPPWTR
jgi:hypothetical protein